MGAIVFSVSLVEDKSGLAVMMKDSVILSISEKFLGKKKSEDGSPSEKKKSGTILSNLVKRSKNSSGGSSQDMGITLDEPSPKSNKDPVASLKESDVTEAEEVDDFQDIPPIPMSEIKPAKTSKFKFFKKKTDRYTNEFGEELSNSKSKGKWRKRSSSGMSQQSSASELEYKDAVSEAQEAVDKSVRFSVDSGHVKFPSEVQDKLNSLDAVDD